MSRFNPYSMNGGTIVALEGANYAIAASDTRLCEEDFYLIHSRNHPHVYKINEKLVLCAAGFNGDVLRLVKTLRQRTKDYSYEFNREMSCNELSQLMQVTLYNQRFFPLYVHNIVVGLDEVGAGAVYSYDVVGSYERERYRATGSSGAILQAFLDNQVGSKNLPQPRPAMSKEDAIKLVRDAFISAAERDIHCGDGVVIHVVTAAGTEVHHFPLRRD